MVAEGALLGDRYRLGSKLASGGMEAIHAGSDERLGRPVAIKLLRSDLTSDGVFVERFRREARAAASLSHPNVAAVYDFGQQEGTPYIVMEHAEGRDLARLIREEGPLDPGRAAAITAQIADALDHAHAAGVIHRDIKPANVMIGPDDRVKVTDFGIARASGDSTLTATGSVLGTAHYISPEQAAGTPAGPSSDIYSLGIVLYEMLTGTLPFTGESPVAVAMRHISDDVPSPASLRDSIPPGVNEVVARATAKDPKLRYTSASAMASALRGSPDTEPLPTAETRTTEQTVWPVPGDRWDPRKVGAIALIVLGVLGLIAAALLLTRAAGGEGEDRDRRRNSATERRERNEERASTDAPEELMPALVGEDGKQLEEQLEARGYVVDVIEVDGEDLEKDLVVATEPVEGSTLEPGQTITLYVSSGKEEEEQEEEEGPPYGRGKEKKEKDD